MEIRLHGRGGQGGVTCAKILAALYARLGETVQTFGDYAGERTGAPVRAYTRVGAAALDNRNKVYRPDHLIVLDPTLLGNGNMVGLASGGTLLVNTAEPPELLGAPLPAFRTATVDATAIARRHGIGSRSVVIVNTTMAGAFARVHGIPLAVLEAAYRDLGLEGNLPAAREAFAAVRVREADAAAGVGPASTAVRAAPRVVQPLVDHVVGPAPGLKTGDWSTQTPRYLRRPAPCNAACPAGNDVVGFVRALATGDEIAAARVLGRTTPFAAVCGRVCPAPCMQGCNRRDFDGAVDIRGLERWIADHAPVARTEAAKCAGPRNIAVVGGGPAGLSAAYRLAGAGHRVTVFDRERALGGLLRTGIPSYRLPREALDREVAGILRLGVEVRGGETVDAERIAALAREFAGVLLATGLQKLSALDVPGVRLRGIEQGIGFLARVNRGERGGVHGRVIVLGGGNTAIDCARSALRAGAERVTVVYRRTRDEMPAIAEEIEQAAEEGVWFLFRRQPVAFRGADRVEAVEAAEVVMGEPDGSGRRRPMVTARIELLGCDAVLLALGQSADLTLLPAGWELRAGRAWCREGPRNVFAAGDFATGDGTVTHAIGSGRRAADLLLEALGESVEPCARPDPSSAVTPAGIRFDHFDRTAPTQEGHEAAGERARDFREVSRGLPGREEASRCCSCGSCTSCDTCLLYCPEGIIHRRPGGYVVDAAYCKGCGLCVSECPRSAMEMIAR